MKVSSMIVGLCLITFSQMLLGQNPKFEALRKTLAANIAVTLSGGALDPYRVALLDPVARNEAKGVATSIQKFTAAYEAGKPGFTEQQLQDFRTEMHGLRGSVNPAVKLMAKEALWAVMSLPGKAPAAAAAPR